MVVCSVHVRHGSAAKGSAEAPVGKTHSNGANIRAALAAIAAGAPGRRAIAGEAPEEEGDEDENEKDEDEGSTSDADPENERRSPA